MNCGSLTVIHGLWLFLKLGRVSLRIVPSGRTMVFVAKKGVGVKSLKALGHSLVSLGFIGTETPMYRLRKDWFLWFFTTFMQFNMVFL